MPEIYVQKSSRNEGYWIDAARSHKEVLMAICDRLGEERWKITGRLGFGCFDAEDELNLGTITKVACLIDEYGEIITYYWYEVECILDDLQDLFEKDYIGQFGSFREFAVDHFRSTYGVQHGLGWALDVDAIEKWAANDHYGIEMDDDDIHIFRR